MQRIGECLLARKRDIVLFDPKVLGENRLVLLIELPAAHIFAHQREESGRVHSFETLFHVLASHDAPVVFLEKEIDFGAKRPKQNDGVNADPSHQEQDRCNSEKDSALHSWIFSPPTEKKSTAQANCVPSWVPKT